MVRFASALLTLVLLAGSAHGMGFRVTETPLAWSPDGRSLLVLVEADGPEGGGYMKYKVVTSRPEGFMTIEPHNDASPGDGSTPQWVNSESCHQQMKRMEERLTALGFATVKYDHKVCDENGFRGGLITVTDDPPQPLRAPEGKKGPIELAGLQITRRGKHHLVIKRGEKTLYESKDGPEGRKLDLFASPNGKLVALFARQPFGNRQVWRILAPQSEAPDALYKEVSEVVLHKEQGSRLETD